MRSQAYPDWELRIVDDGSTESRVREAVERSAVDERIKAAVPRATTSGISTATNRALDQCEGEMVAFLDHDDVLAPEALLRVVREFSGRPADAMSSTATRTS